MRSLATALLATTIGAAAIGCGRGEVGTESEPSEAPTTAEFVPSHLTGRYTDGRILVRFPHWWSESRSERFGVVFGDNSTRHAGFVSVKYLPQAELPARAEYVRFAAELVRPGGRLIPLYTQAARVGGVRGIETAFIWPMSGTRGPLMRAFAFDRGSHGVAFLVFASERPETHARNFAWVRKNIVWMREPRHERLRPTRGGALAPGY
jgi:hypothetical protein